MEQNGLTYVQTPFLDSAVAQIKLHYIHLAPVSKVSYNKCIQTQNVQELVKLSFIDPHWEINSLHLTHAK